MSGFLYFIPRTASLDDWRGLHLDHAFDRPPAMTELGRDRAPGGRAGTVYHRWPGPRLPEPIDWHPAAGGYWIGVAAGQPPTPAELRRPLDIGPGFQVRLADGNYWTVPRVLACTDRDPERIDGLPRLPVRREDSEEPAFILDPIYAPLVELARDLLRTMADAGADAANGGQVLEFCGRALGVCYRIGLEEVLALKLLRAETAEFIVAEAVDALERIKAATGPDEAELVALADAKGWNWAVIQQQRRLDAETVLTDGE